MSAKLVVHKIESDINYKSLQITIDDGENGSNEVSYSEWTDGKTLLKKVSEIPSRLIVKIVSGDECNSINLDSCAKEIEKVSEVSCSDSSKPLPYDKKHSLLCYEVNEYENTNTALHTYDRENCQYNDDTNYKVENTCTKETGNGLENLSPLEYSLERVKENNARIMDNITLLNRALNYTQKKEILDIVYPNSMRYPCNICGKCFVYETGLKRHYSMQHAIKEIQPRWQVVWTCIECFQVWPRQDLHQCCRNNNAISVREIKTSLLLQCEFCEKVYTSIPRLLRHSKLHTTARNYECNACESIFQSYKAAEQHWLMCPWLQMCYSFSLPKMLLCNACDRKFKNYEQLYNHRYKVGHFMTKTHFNSGIVKTLGKLVYQCEICSQWFPSIPPLQTHRSQHHSGPSAPILKDIYYVLGSCIMLPNVNH